MTIRRKYQMRNIGDGQWLVWGNAHLPDENPQPYLVGRWAEEDERFWGAGEAEYVAADSWGNPAEWVMKGDRIHYGYAWRDRYAGDTRAEAIQAVLVHDLLRFHVKHSGVDANYGPSRADLPVERAKRAWRRAVKTGTLPIGYKRPRPVRRRVTA